ncbi:homoserine kinase [Flavisolibacter ginsengisoli]|jgi:homoserine kinase|uniref:Homoserine kinase n=1 Tax=Flavisolibacter ginsengisoli DSM 18119 TaxID=1121884 RepID=A0A1M5GAU4_9BACT|nr:homoserine kinase [Flavisolibacter ginsengisoli]SHG00877.1 homoserine kinase [Flavisolibacter ginsengisoli DSM 18119]
MDTIRSVTVQSPGTIANLVCGFDVLGLALHQPFDCLTLKLIDRPEVEIINHDDYGLPTDPVKNVSGVVLLSIMERLHNGVGFQLISEKKIKPGSGIGSSAASAAGAAVAANMLLGNIFNKEELVQFAMNGEKLASGVKHADNIAPCIYGGITLVRSIHPLDIISIPAPSLFVTVVHPQIEVKTADARQILKKEILLKNAIKQWGNVAGLVAGFFKNDLDLISRSLEDVVIEPLRSILIPGFDEVKVQSKTAGALGGGISGSGPSIFMLSASEGIAKEVAQLMSDVYTRLGIDFHTYVTTINQKGIIQTEQ